MRPLVAGVFLVLACGFLGCASVTPDIPPSAGETLRPSLFDPEKAPDSLFVDSAVIERPAEDLYCTETVWESCDEQFVGLEQLAQFERNGWRVGRLTAPLPSKLQNLLNSKRSCSGPRRQRARAEEPLRVALGGTRDRRIVEVQGRETRRLELGNAQGQLEVLPRLEEERLIVRITPAMVHGESRPRHAVEESPEGSLRWALDVRDPTESFPELAFQISLQAGEYLLIGPRGEDRYSVGHALLTEKQDDQLLSRWILLRAVRPRTAEGPTPESKSAPLALQAGYGTARGASR